MKKILALFLAMLFTVTAFGMLVSGVFYTAAAEENTLEYTQIPGFSAFSEEELEKLQNPFASFSGFSDERKMANFTVEKTDSWGRFVLATCEDVDCLGEPMSPWNGKASIGGKDIFGETGASFAYADGVKFSVYQNTEPYTGRITLLCHQVPSCGPYYSGDDTSAPVGLLFEATGKAENGEFYFDFDNNFKQLDWWSLDDDGENMFEQEDPVPMNVRSRINGFTVYLAGVNIGDSVSIGKFAVCNYKFPRREKLDEQIARFETLDKNSYTQETYAAALEVYLRLLSSGPSSNEEVYFMSRELKAAIDGLKPLFLIKNKRIPLAGFEVWAESDLEIISRAPYDTAKWSGKDLSTLEITANYSSGAPFFSWSVFSSAITREGEKIAVGNPFEVLSEGKTLRDTDGIGFNIEFSQEMLDNHTGSIMIGVGSSKEDKYFEAFASLDMISKGYLAIPWSLFEELNGNSDIAVYLDSLDYIDIGIESGRGVYYISDFSAAKWSYSAADIDDLVFTISEAFDYMSPLDKSEYHYKSWDRAIDAIIKGVAISNKYGASQKEVDSACEEILTAINKLTFLGDPGIHNLRLGALSEISYAIDKNTVTPESYQKLMDAIAEANEFGYHMHDEVMAACDRIVEMMKALVRADGEEWEVPVVTNISDGDVIDVSNGGFIPVWENGTALINYMDIPAGTPIYLNGEYTIEVYNGGAVTSVNFTVTGEVSAPVISGVEHGKTYTSVTVSWDHGTGRLNGEAVENGTTIDEDGVYILQVTGVNKESSVVFRIVGEDNNLSGDLDGDGEVTVSDALIALRVTARISQPDGNILQLADLDGDGEISVSDALAILRIAAGII